MGLFVAVAMSDLNQQRCLCMSCRVLHRGVEEALLRSCAESADGKANGSIGARAHTRALVTLVELQETVDKILFSPLPCCGMNLLPSFLGPLFLKLPSCRITGLGVEAMRVEVMVPFLPTPRNELMRRFLARVASWAEVRSTQPAVGRPLHCPSHYR